MRFINRSHALVVCASVCIGALHAHAEPLKFDFKDPKGVNAMSFVLDSLIEPIIGVASGISGTVSFDSANVGAMRGTIKVDAASLDLPQKRMASVMHSKDWLNVAEHSTIEFTFKKVNNTTPVREGVYALEVTGDFTCRGITRAMTIPVNVTYLPGKRPERTQRGNGYLAGPRHLF